MQNDSDRGKQYVPPRQIRESGLTRLGCRPAGGAAHTGVARGPHRKRRGIADATWLAVQKASVVKEMTCCRAYAWSREDVSPRQGTALRARPFVPTVPEYVLGQWYESFLSGPIKQARWGTVVV